MFDPSLANTFETFSIYHLIPVLIIFSIIATIIYYRKALSDWKYLKAFTYTLGSMTLLQEVSLNIYRIAMGEWQLSTSLPLQLCGIGVLTTGYLMFTKNKKVFQNMFFILMIGASMALITPSIESKLGFPHYRYFQFFLSHGLIVINITVLLFVYDFQKHIKYRHLLNNFFSLAVIALILLVVDLSTGGNYLYLMGKPGEGTAFDLFGDWPWYIINIFFFGIPIFFHIFYFPFFIRNYIQSKRVAEIA